ncbi:flagellar protein [Vallitalea sp.]|jgi:flagellar operon protein (TIGR03826 family)|uniref:flagellar protein n=1 Tax=Vallitalea sp. TaxID=1882829 RepID=UPI0025D7845C|nr:flagellar protein [Vallitalea sp.]MCT4687974.1 flagellar protein [Vallitalea sp.]
MNVRNCVKCGKIFNYIGGVPICPACKSKLNDLFEVTKKYIRDNPNANIAQVAEECEVSIKLIHQWVREERLIFAEGSAIGIECEICGDNIRTGRYCDKCKYDIQHNLTGAYDEEDAIKKSKKDEVIAKMRYLNKDS